MHLLTLQFISHLHANLGNSSLYTLDVEKLFEWNAVRLFSLTAPDSCLLSAFPLEEIVQPLQIGQHAAEGPGMEKLDSKGAAVRPLVTSPDAGFPGKTKDRSWKELELRSLALYLTHLWKRENRRC